MEEPTFYSPHAQRTVSLIGRANEIVGTTAATDGSATISASSETTNNPACGKFDACVVKNSTQSDIYGSMHNTGACGDARWVCIGLGIVIPMMILSCVSLVYYYRGSLRISAGKQSVTTPTRAISEAEKFGGK